MIAIRWVGHPRSYGVGRSHGITCVIVHNTEGREGRGTAQAGHDYDVNRTDGTSTHVLVDTVEALQEVEYENTAYAAFQHGNGMGVQVELCHPGEWDLNEPNDAATFDNGAQVVAQICLELRLPAVWLDETQARAAWFGSAKGITGHAEITKAFPEDGGDHFDPRESFPRAEFVRRVAAYMGGAAAGGDDMRQYRFDAHSYPDRPADLGDDTIVTDGCGIYFQRPNTFQMDAPALSGGMSTVVVVKGSAAGTMPTGWSFGKAFASLTGGCSYGAPVAPWRAVAASTPGGGGLVAHTHSVGVSGSVTASGGTGPAVQSAATEPVSPAAGG